MPFRDALCHFFTIMKSIKKTPPFRISFYAMYTRRFRTCVCFRRYKKQNMEKISHVSHARGQRQRRRGSWEGISTKPQHAAKRAIQRCGSIWLLRLDERREQARRALREWLDSSGHVEGFPCAWGAWRSCKLVGSFGKARRSVLINVSAAALAIFEASLPLTAAAACELAAGKE